MELTVCGWYPFRYPSTVAVRPTLPPFDQTSPTSGCKRRRTRQPGYFGPFCSTWIIPQERSYSVDSRKYCNAATLTTIMLLISFVLDVVCSMGAFTNVGLIEDGLGCCLIVYNFDVESTNKSFCVKDAILMNYVLNRLCNMIKLSIILLFYS